MRRRAAALRVAALVGAVTMGCGDNAPTSEWDGAVVRAVARRVEDAGGGGIVIAEGAGRSGEELPWSVRQALVTAGYDVGPATEAAGTRVLVFDGSTREGTDWLVDVRIRDVGEGAAVAGVRWRVRCIDAPCEVVDSLAIPRPEAERSDG